MQYVRWQAKNLICLLDLFVSAACRSLQACKFFNLDSFPMHPVTARPAPGYAEDFQCHLVYHIWCYLHETNMLRNHDLQFFM
ncbi:hypothetical protein BKA93DRAFT_765318 [Sparassis latifolia]